MALTQQQKWGRCIALVSIALIAFATLRPGPHVPIAHREPGCSRWEDDKLLADFLLNVLLFLPLGFGGRLAGFRPLAVIGSGAALSAAIELLQLRVIPGRDASLLDVISNSLGTTAGLVVAVYLAMLVAPTPRQAARLVGGGATVVVLMVVAAVWALGPAPGGNDLWGQLTPVLGFGPPYDGELLAARLNGMPLASERIIPDETLRDAMRSGLIDLSAVVRPAPPDGQGGAIVRIADGCGREILLLSQLHSALKFKFRMDATAVGLETPSFQLTRAFAPPADHDGSDAADSVSVHLGGGRLALTVAGAHSVHRVVFPLSPAMSWAFFLPWSYSLGGRSWIWSSLWLAALLVPVGYWGGRAVRGQAGRYALLASSAAVVASLALAPWLRHLPPVTHAQWLAVIVGAGAGWAAAVAARSALMRD